MREWELERILAELRREYIGLNEDEIRKMPPWRQSIVRKALEWGVRTGRVRFRRLFGHEWWELEPY